MPKLAGIRPPTEERSRVLLAPPLADTFRQVCRYLDRDADSVFEEMLELFIRERTNLDPVYESEPESPSGGIFEKSIVSTADATETRPNDAPAKKSSSSRRRGNRQRPDKR